MKVFVTGAGGGVGSQTTSQLVADGHEVVALDKRCRFELPVPLHEVNLLDEAGVTSCVQGCDAVVHLGNYTGAGFGRRTNQTTFNENMAMNMNVFNAALEAGVKKIVFASSIQVIASEDNWPATALHCDSVAYLPLDANSPGNPTNSYAMSKLLGETMLSDYFAAWGIECVSLRLPRLFFPGYPPKGYEPVDLNARHHRARIAQGFALLSYPDAARAILACLYSTLPGHRIYLPALSEVTGELVKPAIERYYRDVPLTKPIGELHSLVDDHHIRQDTGWVPQDSLQSVMAHA